jgi:hypothetical protein
MYHGDVCHDLLYMWHWVPMLTRPALPAPAGMPWLGLRWQGLESSALRSYLGLAPGQTGESWVVELGFWRGGGQVGSPGWALNTAEVNINCTRACQHWGWFLLVLTSAYLSTLRMHWRELSHAGVSHRVPNLWLLLRRYSGHSSGP